jgi:tetratricopeptide (TPR) repeat protein
MNAPKVFISYSHDSPRHDRQVFELAGRLRSEGIDCIIDQYEPAPASGWPLWMEEQITVADYVLMVCTETYNKRVHRKDEPNKGFGVCWEANIIYNYLYIQKLENHKFIPILFSDTDKKHIPIVLQGYTHYLVSAPDGYDELYRRLTNQPKVTIPELKELRSLPPLERQTDFFPGIPIHNLPFDENPQFFGREEFLTKLNDIFATGESAALTQAITGLGGVGKTQIALAYAYRYAASYQVIWWVRAENSAIIDTDYYKLAHMIGFQDPIADREQVIGYVKGWLEKHHDWLVIFDNAMDYGQIQEYLPKFKKGHLLITTRNTHFEIDNRLAVDVFEPEVAAQFLKTQTGRQDDDGAFDLAKTLGGLPLALEQATAYMVANKMNYRSYLELFAKTTVRLFSKSKPPVGYYDTVLTTWKVSLDQLTDQASWQLLYLSAFLNPDHINQGFLAAGINILPQPLADKINDESELYDVLTQLETYSLIQRKETDSWGIHRLLQEVIRESLGEEKKDWAKYAIGLINENWNYDYHQMETWEKSREALPQLLAVLKTAIPLQLNDSQSGLVCNNGGYYLICQGRYEEAEPLIKRALEIRERMLGANHPDTAISLNSLAVIYENQGRYKEAEPLIKRALEIRERALGGNHPDTATSLNDLAGVYESQGQYEEAEPLYKRALEIKERVLGADHTDTAIALNNLAGVYESQGQYEEAEPLYKRALEIFERVLGVDHPYTATSLNNLANLYYNQGRYEKAEPLFKRTLEIFGRVLGADHPNTATSLNNLAGLYMYKGRYEEAESLNKWALEITERVLGPDHPDMAQSFNNLAELYSSQGRYEEAEPLYKRALEIKERVLGTDHPDTSTSLNNLAGLYQNQGRYEEAELLYKRALEIRERMLGADHPDTATSLNNLAYLYNNWSRYKEAEPLFKEALEICIKVLGKEHPNTQTCLKNLVAYYESQNQIAATQQLMRKFYSAKQH